MVWVKTDSPGLKWTVQNDMSSKGQSSKADCLKTGLNGRICLNVDVRGKCMVGPRGCSKRNKSFFKFESLPILQHDFFDVHDPLSLS